MEEVKKSSSPDAGTSNKQEMLQKEREARFSRLESWKVTPKDINYREGVIVCTVCV